MIRDDLLVEEIEALAQTALRLVRESPGRLVGLTVRIPPDLPTGRFRELFGQRLADVGLDFVDLAVESGSGPMRIVAADFHTE
jgi:hypothetical protein